MIQAIIGAVVGILIGIFGFLFHKRGDRIKELEKSNENKDKQIKIDAVNRNLSKPLEEVSDEETTDSLIDKWNNPDRMQDD